MALDNEPICRPWRFTFKGGRTDVMSLVQQYQHLLQVLEWIDPASTMWMIDHTRVLELLKTEP